MKPEEKYNELKAAYEAEYQRTTGKTIQTAYYNGYVRLYDDSGSDSSVRVKDFENMLSVLRSRPDFNAEKPKVKQLFFGRDAVIDICHQLYSMSTTDSTYNGTFFDKFIEDNL